MGDVGQQIRSFRLADLKASGVQPSFSYVSVTG